MGLADRKVPACPIGGGGIGDCCGAFGSWLALKLLLLKVKLLLLELLQLLLLLHEEQHGHLL